MHHRSTRILVSVLLTLAIALLSVVSLNCSVIDASDKDALDERISAMPTDVKTQLRIMTTKVNALNWLKHKSSNDRVGSVKCKYDLHDGQGWEDILVEDGDLLVDFMIQCLRGGLNRNYISCALSWAKPNIKVVKDALDFKLKNNSTLKNMGADLSKLDIECRYEWDWRYDPIGGNVPIECVDPAAVTDDEIINAIVGMPTPPPGFLGSDIGALLPYLCPLDAGPGWGCPSPPSNPSGGLTSGVGATSGGG